MRSRLVIFFIVGFSLLFGLAIARQIWQSSGRRGPWVEETSLRVLTYSTFASAQGPGGSLKKLFEDTCQCKVEFTTVADAGLLLERLSIGRFDVVIGLDQFMLAGAREKVAWRGFDLTGVDWVPAVEGKVQEHFLPFDWSPMSFVYRHDDQAKPEKLDDLLRSEWKRQFALQDPRASTPGLQFLNWVRTVKREGAKDFLRAFKANVNSVSPSWAFSYGLFEKRQTRFVFSYLTSLAFHWQQEGGREFDILSFPEGHPVQYEFVGVPDACEQCDLAAEFVSFLMQPEQQKIIMERGFMLPSVKGVVDGTVFAELPALKLLDTIVEREFTIWDEVFKN
ncbi:MAG: thiamine ABC transporter substrate-binding protein [Bdellovibrionales bacterium]